MQINDLLTIKDYDKLDTSIVRVTYTDGTIKEFTINTDIDDVLILVSIENENTFYSTEDLVIDVKNDEENMIEVEAIDFHLSFTI